MAIIKTVIKVPSMDDAVYNIPGEWTAAQIKVNYTNHIPGITNMVDTTVDSQTPEGLVRQITFSPRSGQKG
jgi:hypothetical protein